MNLLQKFLTAELRKNCASINSNKVREKAMDTTRVLRERKVERDGAGGILKVNTLFVASKFVPNK